MPLAGASKDLASVFGVEFTNGFVIDTLKWDLNEFKKEDSTLQDHATISKSVNSVSTYFGQGFEISNDSLAPLLKFKGHNTVNYLPQKAWEFHENTITQPATDLLQGAVGLYGKGKIVVLGDSSLLSAYLIGKNKRKIGFNSESHPDNLPFVLNIFKWLSQESQE